MSLGWKKFNFFSREERPDITLPANACCTSSNADELLLGCEDGTVILLDHTLRQQRSFQAHARRLHALHRSKGAATLVTVGNDVDDDAAAALRVWGLEGAAAGGASAEPALLRSVRLFAPKLPAGPLQAVAVHEESWPSVSVAFGVGAGGVYLLRGDIVRERVSRTICLPQEDGAAPVSALRFADVGGGGGAAALYAVTAGRTRCIDCRTGNVSVLDEAGGAPHCADVNEAGELAVARDEAVYLYTPDGRGPCFVFEGRKEWLVWAGHQLVVASSWGSDVRQHTLQVYDMRNKLVAASHQLASAPPQVVAPAFGQVLLVEGNGSVSVLREKELGVKAELLASKNLFPVALNLLAGEQEADPKLVSEMHRRYGDHLYAKHDYDASVQQYIATIGQLEPSYVIRRYLDAQRIHNLTLYLQHLHEEGSASADHTTLLLNCYAKLKDVEKLDRFIRAEDAAGKPALSFDVDTAIKVLRGAGYPQHALFVAHAAGERAVYLDVLLDDTAAYDEALAYLQGLPRRDAAEALQRHGKALITHRPEATTALLMQLCTLGDASAADGSWTAQVSDFSHLYSDRPLALMLLCEFILNSSAAPGNEAVLYHTLLELYLQDELVQGEAAGQEASGPTAPRAASRARRRESALELLRRGWPAGEPPKYDPEHALVVSAMHGFRPGLAFLYETMRMFREVLRVHAAAGDHGAMLEAAVRLGDASRGGDPQLWSELLEHLGRQQEDCLEEVRAALSHIEAGGLLPPLLVVQALAANERLQLGCVKEYVARALQAETAAIEEDRAQIAKYQAETAAMRSELAELRGAARVFQNSKCALSGAPLELPQVHFMCGHSFNLRALPDSEGRECPLCAPGFRSILDIRRSMRGGGEAEQDRFFTQLQHSRDGFAVVADFFGRGLLNNTSIAQRAASEK